MTATEVTEPTAPPADRTRRVPVDFALTDGQRRFRDAVRSLVEDELTPVAPEWKATGWYPPAMVARLREQGLFGLDVPARYGGLAADGVSIALAFEEVARASLDVAELIGQHSVACWLVARNGTVVQKARYLRAMATGELRAGLGLTEAGAGADLAGTTTTAVRVRNHYVVSGAKTWIAGAPVAGLLAVLVKVRRPGAPPDALSVLLTETAHAGCTVAGDPPALVLDEVRVPAENLLGGTEGRGVEQVGNGFRIGRVIMAARAVGMAQAAYDAALGDTRDRAALAEVGTRIAEARLLTYRAADRSRPVDTAAGRAELCAAEAAVSRAREAVRRVTTGADRRGG